MQESKITLDLTKLDLTKYDEDYVEYLRDYDNYINEDVINDLFFQAVELEYIDVVKFFLDSGVNINILDKDAGSYNYSAVRLSIIYQNIDMLEMLINYGAELNNENDTLLSSAITMKNKKIIEILLDNKINIDNISGMLAVKNNDLEILKLLLHYGLDAYVTLKNSLHRASSEAVELLLENISDINNQDNKGTSLLEKAVMLDDIPAVEILLSSKIDANATSIEGLSVLALALNKPSIKTMKKQLDKSNFSTLEKEKALTNYNPNINTGIVKLLLDYGADVNFSSNGISAIDIAVMYGYKEMLISIFNNGADINMLENKGTHALLFSCLQGLELESIKKIGKIKTIEERIKYIKLLNAEEWGIDKNIANLLIDNGADINGPIDNDNETSLLLLFVLLNKVDVVEVLIDLGAEVNKQPTLSLAVINGNEDMVKLLLDNEAYVDFKDGSNSTALMMACISGIDKDIIFGNIKGLTETKKIQMFSNFNSMKYSVRNIEVVKLLIAKADLNIVNSLGETAYSYSRQSKFREATILLNKNGAEKIGTYRIKDSAEFEDILEYENEDTSLSKAIRTKNIQILEVAILEKDDFSIVNLANLVIENYPLDFIQLMLEKTNIDINSIDSDDSTALMLASSNGNKELVKLLIENNANLNMEDKDGDEAFDHAENKGHDDIVAMLFEAEKALKKRHNPQILVKLLKNFTVDTPIKCTTHSWEASCESCRGMSFDEFIDRVRGQWNKIKDEFYLLSPNLYQKIDTFIFAEDINGPSWCKETNLNMGWSSTKGLQKHINDGKKPLEFVLKTSIKISKNETLTTFREVVRVFKEQIEIRNDSNMLEKIFDEFEIKLNNNNIACDICSSLRGIDFYTDVEKFKSALDIIFDQIIHIHDVSDNKNELDEVVINVRRPEDSELKYIELHITHLNSSSNRLAKDLLEETNDGHFKGIQEYLKNLCDWRVEDSYKNKGFRVDYLKSKNIPNEQLSYIPNGFTHILTFYR